MYIHTCRVRYIIHTLYFLIILIDRTTSSHYRVLTEMKFFLFVLPFFLLFFVKKTQQLQCLYVEEQKSKIKVLLFQRSMEEIAADRCQSPLKSVRPLLSLRHAYQYYFETSCLLLFSNRHTIILPRNQY